MFLVEVLAIRCYTNFMKLHGRVIAGLGIGKQLGYPTANLEIFGGSASGAPEAEPRDIQSGVYAARVTFDGATYDAAVIIGARLKNDKPLIEIYFLDFEGDLYGQELQVAVVQRISDIVGYKDEEELIQKIKQDVEKVRLCLPG